MSNRISPFHIESSSYPYDDDDAGWQDDTDDLDELLEDMEEPYDDTYDNPRPPRPPHRPPHSAEGWDYLPQLLGIGAGFVFLFLLISLGGGGKKGDDGGDVVTSPDGLYNQTGGGGEVHEVQRIAVLGERNSGMQWLTNKMTECYPNLEVTPSLMRQGHWFQDAPPPRGDGKPPDTLAVAVFLNSYDWVQLMLHHPEHMPSHTNLKWHEFVTKPWTIERPERDERMANERGAVCQLGFDYNRVVSCVAGEADEEEGSRGVRELTAEFNPIYELNIDGSGKPYESIVDLRADKIKNFLRVKEWEKVLDVMTVRYEDLVKDTEDSDGKAKFPGLIQVLVKVKELTGLEPSCDVTKEGGEPYRAEPLGGDPNSMPQRYWSWMNEHVDWEVEKMVGYNKRTEAPSGGDKEDEDEKGDSADGDGNGEQKTHMDAPTKAKPKKKKHKKKNEKEGGTRTEDGDNEKKQEESDTSKEDDVEAKGITDSNGPNNDVDAKGTGDPEAPEQQKKRKRKKKKKKKQKEDDGESRWQ